MRYLRRTGFSSDEKMRVVRREEIERRRGRNSKNVMNNWERSKEVEEQKRMRIKETTSLRKEIKEKEKKEISAADIPSGLSPSGG